MGNFMCGNNEAANGSFNFFEGLTYNYIKKPGQHSPLSYDQMKSYKSRRSICSRMSRNTRDKQKGERHETLLSQFSRNRLRERSASLSMVLDLNEDETLLLKAPFSDLCKLNINQNRLQLAGSQKKIEKNQIFKNSNKKQNGSYPKCCKLCKREVIKYERILKQVVSLIEESKIEKEEKNFNVLQKDGIIQEMNTASSSIVSIGSIGKAEAKKFNLIEFFRSFSFKAEPKAQIQQQIIDNQQDQRLNEDSNQPELDLNSKNEEVTIIQQENPDEILKDDIQCENLSVKLLEMTFKPQSLNSQDLDNFDFERQDIMSFMDQILDISSHSLQLQNLQDALSINASVDEAELTSAQKPRGRSNSICAGCNHGYINEDLTAFQQSQKIYQEQNQVEQFQLQDQFQNFTINMCNPNHPFINFDRYESAQREDELMLEELEMFDDQQIMVEEEIKKPQNQISSLLGDFSLMLEIYFNDDSTSQTDDKPMGMGKVDDIELNKTSPFASCTMEDLSKFNQQVDLSELQQNCLNLEEIKPTLTAQTI